MAGKSYRACVVAVFINSENKLLVAQRKNYPGGWQFPQGGVDQGETFEQALKREMYEELGIKDFEILKDSQTLYRYDFPKELMAPIASKYKGQEQKWFLCRLKEGHEPDLSKASDEEFNDITWLNADEVIKHIIKWKKEVYQLALREFSLTA